MFRFALTLAFAAVMTASACASPALWSVQSGKAKVFGTIHVLKPSTVWHTPALDKALNGSDALWLEVSNPDDAAAVRPLIAQIGLDRAHPLSRVISKDDVALVMPLRK